MILKTVSAACVAVVVSAGTVAALPPIETNERIFGELVQGEVSYQIHKHCDTISMRRLRALGRLNELHDYARSIGYTDEQVKGLEDHRPKRDARVNAYLAKHNVTKGDGESYCRLGRAEIAKKSLTGWLLRSK